MLEDELGCAASTSRASLEASRPAHSAGRAMRAEPRMGLFSKP